MTICWTLAGSDSGGGAGIAADLRTFHGLGVHGCSVITAVTAQNTLGVARVEPLDTAIVEAQLQALEQDLPPLAVKTGMLARVETVDLVAGYLDKQGMYAICDPVAVASSGDSLGEAGLTQAIRTRLIPHIALLTPNLPEAGVLTGLTLDAQEPLVLAQQMERAADRLLEMGTQAVFIKGGHGLGDFCQDYFSDGETHFWLTAPRRDTPHSHGTGCTLSAAITAAVGLGYPLPDAVVIGKAYVSQALRMARPIGSGNGPVFQGGWPMGQQDLPWLTFSPEEGMTRTLFPDTGPEPLGFYPIVDSVSWLKCLLPRGVRTIQLRIKDLQGDALREQIQQAVALAQAHQCRLFINDFWREAIAAGAYGVHLGQEDLQHMSTHELRQLQQSGIRLGVSTHCYREVARALAVRPSYIAIGPIYETTVKKMKFGPQGLDMLARWCQSLDYPLVAIGGISLERAPGVLRTGANSIAVITAISQAADPLKATDDWLALFT